MEEVIEEKVSVECEICGKVFDSSKGLRGHNMTCKVKQKEKEDEIEVERQKALVDFEDEIEADKTAEYTEERDNREREGEERVPFGTQEPRLHVPERDGYRIRIFNSGWTKEPGRIERAEAAGYRVVEDSPVNGTVVGTNKDGTPIKAVVMEIPRKWFEEDQAKKEERIAQREKQMFRGELNQTEKAENRYVPKGLMNKTVYTN